MERAYDDAKYGRYSRRPYIDMVIPTLTDPSVAPPGKHILSCFVQYAPYHLRGTTWDEQREAFGDTVIDTIAEFAPNIRDIILHRQVLTPLDLEREFGLTEGNIFHGELTLEQLFFLRPAPGWAQVPDARARPVSCAVPARIPAAASWRRLDGTPRGPSSRMRSGRRPARDAMHNARCTMHTLLFRPFGARTSEAASALEPGAWSLEPVG